MPSRTEAREIKERRDRYVKWLAFHGGRKVHAWKAKDGTKGEVWEVGIHLATLVTRPSGAIALLVPAGANAVDALELLPESPGVEEDGQRGTVYWKQEGGDHTEDAGPAWRDDLKLFDGRWVSAATARRYAKKHGHAFVET